MGYCWALRVTTGLCEILLGTVGYCWVLGVLGGITRYCGGTAGFYKDLHSTAAYCGVMWGSVGVLWSTCRVH